MEKIVPLKKIKKIKPFARTIKKAKTRALPESPVKPLVKAGTNPMLSPQEKHRWEAWQTFNPGAILLDDKVHFIYRAIGSDGLSRFGYAMSRDGFTIDKRLAYPVYEHGPAGRQSNYFSLASGGSWGGCEDPRLIKVDGEDRIYMTYTACDDGLRVGLTSIAVADFLKNNWRWRLPKLISPPGQVHKNWVIFPEKIRGKYAILHSLNPEVEIAYRDSLEFSGDEFVTSLHDTDYRRQDCWDGWIRGAGPAPIKTRYGWLLFYHAMDKDNPSQYKVGAMLLDLEDPTMVLHRLSAPILQPVETYENEGFKSGVAYASGAVVKDGRLLLYYGGADTHVCVAYADFAEFLEMINKDANYKLEEKAVLKIEE